jgi:hypothetical protein
MVERSDVPDVARDEKVVSKRKALLDAMNSYADHAAKFAATGSWQDEIDMLHMEQYDIPGALKDLSKAAKKFYQKNPDGHATKTED